MTGNARTAALAVLEKCRRSGGWSEAVLDHTIQKYGLSRRDAALCSQICYGVLQNRTLLDFYVQSFTEKALRQIEPKVLDILRISIYQLVFLTKIPASAAVNTGVALSKSSGFSRASGFINAILRRISENLNRLPEPSECGTAEYLSVKYSHPLWFAEEMTTRLGYRDAEAFFTANNASVPVTIQVNSLKVDPETLFGILSEAGLSIRRHPWLSGCFFLDTPGSLSRLPEMQEGLFYVQDAAARLAVMAAAPEPGMRVLDACAAPGGKSFAAAMLMQNCGSITSCDLHDNKLVRIRAGAERLGISILSAHAMDASCPRPEYIGAFDCVIADVPCSGMGVIRKKPEIRYKSLEALAGLPEIQFRILQAISACTAPGGVLLYSTCTVRESENEAVVNRFLQCSMDFDLEAFHLSGQNFDGMTTLWPHKNETDGFFIAKLRRKA